MHISNKAKSILREKFQKLKRSLRWDDYKTIYLNHNSKKEMAKITNINELSLKLKVGARVLLTKNLDVENGLCNGTTGEIVRFYKGLPVIKYTNITTGKEVERLIKYANIKEEIKVSFEKNAFDDCEDRDNIKRLLSSGSFTFRTTIAYIPLILAYAITIHRSQGMTLDEVRLNASCFTEGQLYTALSRVRNKKKIYTLRTSPFRH